MAVDKRVLMKRLMKLAGLARREPDGPTDLGPLPERADGGRQTLQLRRQAAQEQGLRRASVALGLRRAAGAARGPVRVPPRGFRQRRRSVSGSRWALAHQGTTYGGRAPGHVGVGSERARRAGRASNGLLQPLADQGIEPWSADSGTSTMSSPDSSRRTSRSGWTASGRQPGCPGREMARRLKINDRTVRRWRLGAKPNSAHLYSLLNFAAGERILHILLPAVGGEDSEGG